VSEGSKDINIGSESSGSINPYQNQSVTPRKKTAQYTKAVVDPTLRMLVFHRGGKKDPE
jgi:hypothetical protein